MTITGSLLIAFALVGAFVLFRVDWKRMLTNPAVVSAVVVAVSALLVALANVLSSEIVASNQRAAETEKMKASVLLSVVQQYEPSMVPARNENNQKQRTRILIPIRNHPG